MKVIAINGSPSKEGNTACALKLVGEELEKEGIDFEILHIGNKVVRGCMGCGACFKNRDEKCIYANDIVNESLQKMKDVDGIILGSPVHFAGVGGTMKSFLDRCFYVAGANRGMLSRKVGASVVAVRRSGGVPAFNQLNNYLLYAEMNVPASNYWNVIHGARPGEALKDEEGVQIMRVLGKNMAWTLRNGTSEPRPEMEKKVMMNFIR